MSRSIDERIVSMEFDNQRFEHNVKTSLTTLDKLKQSLNLTGAAKGLENVTAAAKSCNLAPLSNAAEAVKVKFSALEVMAVTALSNITNSAVNAGKRIAKSLTIDPIKTGFSEYELKMGSIQTIMASTGESLSTVNDYLNELNTYSDKTIYSFSDMTQNIGKFTNAGVKLEDAVAAIKGISNEAALSGANANEASRAMYNFAQALSAGYVKLIDWKSIENANMATVDFKNQLIETAAALGTVTKVGDGLYKTMSGETFNATKNFNETLQDQWMTTDVLVKTLNMYADETTEIGKKATQAATEVKTFSMMLDSLKEAAQSGWAQTWELIFGNFTEGKSLWTSINNVVSGMLESSADSRNNFLKGALHNSGWDKIINRIEEAGGSAGEFEETLKRILIENNYPIEKRIEEYGSLEEVFRSGTISSKWLQEAVDELNGSISEVDVSVFTRDLKKGLTGDDVAEMQQALQDLGYDFSRFGVDGIFGSETQAAVKAFQEAMGLEITGIFDDATVKELEKATTKTSELKVEIQDLLGGVTELGGRELLLESFGNLWKAISKPLTAIKNVFKETFSIKPETLFKLIEGFHKFTEMLIMDDENAEKLGSAFKGLFSIFELGTSIIGGGLKLAFKGLMYILDHFDLNILDVAASVGNALTTFKEWIFENGILAQAFYRILDVLIMVGVGIYKFGKALLELPVVQGFLTKVTEAFDNLKERFGTLKEDMKNGGFVNVLVKAFKGLLVVVGAVASIVGGAIVGIVALGKKLYDAGKAAYEWIKAFFMLPEVQDKIATIKDTIVDTFSKPFRKVKNFFGLIKNFIAGTDVIGEDGIKKMVSTDHIVTYFKEEVLGAFEKINFKSIWEKIKAPMSGIKDALVDYVKNIDFKAILEKLAEFFTGIITKLTDAIKNIEFKAIFAKIKGWFSSFKDSVSTNLGTVGEKFSGVKDAVVGFFTTIKEKIGNNWGKILALGSLIAFILILNKIRKAVQLIASPLDTFDDLCNNIGKAFKSLGLYFKSAAVKNIAISIGILAASLIGLAMLDQGKLWSAVGALSVMTILLGALVFVVGKFGPKDAKDMTQMAIGALSLAGSILILALAAKIIAGINGWDLAKAGLTILGFVGILALVSKATSNIGRGAVALGKMMLQLSGSLIIMALAIKILGGMEPKTLIQGGLAITYFMGLIVGMMAATKLMGKNIGKFGTMMIQLSAALVLMSIAVGILGKMELRTLIQGGLAITYFMGLMVGMMAATKLLGKDVGRFGMTMLGLSSSLIMIALAINILGKMDLKTVIKGGLIVTAIMGVMVGMIGTMQSVMQHAKNAGKIGLLMLGFSGAILIITGAILALSIIEGKDLAKATLALAGITLIFGGLVYVSKFAKNVKMGTLIGLGVAVAILAASIAALSFIDTKDLAKATIALGAIMGMLSLLAFTSKFVKAKSLVTITLMGLIVAGLGYVLTKLTDGIKDPDGALKVATAMSAIILALSGACALVAAAGKTGKNVKYGLVALAGVVGIFGIVAGIAIWQLPNIGKQLSSFMDNLKPFFDGLKGVPPGAMKSIKILGEAMWEFTKAGALYAVSNALTGGGMGDAFSAFKDFIKEAVPIVKDIAVEVSDMDINVDNLNAIVGAIKTLAEAASSIPSDKAFAAFGAWGVAAGFSKSNLSEFTAFILAAVPEVTKLAETVKAKNINADNVSVVKSVCEAIGILAEAADAAPTVDILGGFSKFGGGFSISWTDYDGFIEFIKGSTEALAKFIEGTREETDSEGVVTKEAITTSEVDLVKTICECIEILATAASNVPSTVITAMAGGTLFKKFGGFGLAAGGAVSIPGYDGFINFISQSLTIVEEFTRSLGSMEGVNSEEAKKPITTEDMAIVTTIADSIRIIGEAVKNVPYEVTAAGGFGGLTAGLKKFGIGAAGGGGTVDVKPMLTAFTTWITEALGALTTFTEGLKSADGKTKFSAKDIEPVKGICEAISAIGGAMEFVPSKTDFSFTGAGGGGGAGMGGAFVVHGEGSIIPMLTEFKDWIAAVLDVLPGFAVSLSDVNLDQSDYETIRELCSAVTVLAQAASAAPTITSFKIPLLAQYVKSTDLEGFKSWIAEVLPMLSEFAAGQLTTPDGETVTLEEVNIGNVKKLTSIAQAAKVIAQAAALAPTSEEMSVLWGVFKWEEGTDLSATTEWFKNVYEMINGEDGLLKNIDTEGIDMDALAKLKELATAVGIIAEAIFHIQNAASYGLTDTQLQEMVNMLGLFQQLVEEANLDTELVSSAAFSLRALVDVLEVLTELGNMASIDTDAFNTKITALASSLSSFESDMTGVDTTDATTQLTNLANIVGGLAYINFTGASAFETALETLGKTGIDKFIEAFSDAVPKVKKAANSLVSTTTATLGSANNYVKFYNAGDYVVQGFAAGITVNTFKAEAAAAAMATAAYDEAKKTLDVNSPSRIFRALAKCVPEGFAMGIDDESGIVEDSSETMATRALNATKKVISRISSFVNSDIDSQPTIRPVLDLSAVSEGAGTINGMFDMNPSIGAMANIRSINTMMNNRQNGANDDVISAIKDLGNRMSNMTGDTYNFDGISYDDGSNIHSAVSTLVRAAKIERRR